MRPLEPRAGARPHSSITTKERRAWLGIGAAASYEEEASCLGLPFPRPDSDPEDPTNYFKKAAGVAIDFPAVAA